MYKAQKNQHDYSIKIAMYKNDGNSSNKKAF